MTVSEQIIQVIDSLCAKMGIVIDWTSENVIPYVSVLCKKLITYEIATSIVWMMAMLLLVVVSIIFIKRCFPAFKNGWAKKDDLYIEGGLILCFLLGFLYITTAIMVFHQTMDIIQCITFPEMYVFEYVSRLM